MPLFGKYSGHAWTVTPFSIKNFRTIRGDLLMGFKTTSSLPMSAMSPAAPHIFLDTLSFIPLVLTD